MSTISIIFLPQVKEFSRQSSSVMDDSSDCQTDANNSDSNSNTVVTISTVGSSIFLASSSSSCVRSPDVSDLYKKFQPPAAANPDSREGLTSNPPDIVTENMPRRDPHSKVEEEDEEERKRRAEAVGEDPIVLSEHLQNMVDRAMKELLEQS